MMDRSEPAGPPLYCYRFGEAEYDETRAELTVAGHHAAVEQRPLKVLALLLRRADEVVPREELFDTVWAGRPTVDNVLANAVSKLRKALGTRAGVRIINVPRIGYRLVGPVERVLAGRSAVAPLLLRPGQPVPGCTHFRLRTCLDPAGDGSVWLARHEKTDEVRVYKFAVHGERLAALKREATIYCVLRKVLGERDDFVRLIDWNFEPPACWLQYQHAGQDLAHWASAHPALHSASREARITWFLQIADAVIAAHGAGVLHGDLKPSNVLVAPHGAGWQFRVADFGSGRLLEPGGLEALGITRQGLTVIGGVLENAGMSLPYVAPELWAARTPSVRGDVYALGLILFQMLAGDMQRTLAPGWEQDIDDELLREDIAAATYGDPEQRLVSVAALARRLRGRELRLIERQRLREADARAQIAERALERARGRRPWLVAAIALLVLGLGTSLWQLDQVREARADAHWQATIAKAANQFLNNDLLGAALGGDAAAGYRRDPTLREILDAAAGRLDRRFDQEPLLRATLHQTLGRAYRSTGDYAEAAAQLQTAVGAFAHVLGTADARSILAQYELASVLARLSRFSGAEQWLSRADTAAGLRRAAVSEIALRSHLAHAEVAYQQARTRSALAHYRAAEGLRRLLHPDDVELSARILLAIADCELQMGRSAQAAAVARRILAGTPATRARIGSAAVAEARARLAAASRMEEGQSPTMLIVRPFRARREDTGYTRPRPPWLCEMFAASRGSVIRWWEASSGCAVWSYRRSSMPGSQAPAAVGTGNPSG